MPSVHMFTTNNGVFQEFLMLIGKMVHSHPVKEYVKYYNTVRPHSFMNNMPLDYKVPNTSANVRCESRLGCCD